ncbi:MAG: HAMP domain-containing sensor histidine kinase [Pseudomonadota bacterium]
MSSSNPANTVGVVPITLAVILSGMALVLTFLSGGFGSGVGSVFLLAPAIIWLIWGEKPLVSAIGSALVGAAGLACFQLFGFVPPPVVSLAQSSLQSLPWVFGAMGLAVLVRLNFRRTPGLPATPSNKAYTDHETQLILPADGPILIFDISKFGRIRARFGAEQPFSNARSGQVASLILVDHAGEALKPGVAQLESGLRVGVLETPHAEGAYLTLLRTDMLGGYSQDELDQELRLRTAFFATLGHDLKSPLNAILGFADMMDMEVRGPMPEGYKEYPGLIKEGGQTLERLIADFLDYAKSESDEYEIDPAPMDVAASADSVIRQSQAAAVHAGVKLRLNANSDVLAMADAGAIRRIWDNLVSNAIKYSGEGQTVELAAQRQGEWVELSVADQGVGMSAQDLELIAEPFAQGSNAKGRAGTGLGLAMVDRLARLHGGQVRIETAPGQGTRVSVTLPAVSEELRKAAE